MSSSAKFTMTGNTGVASMTAGDSDSCEGTLGWQPTYEGVLEQPPQVQTLGILPLGQVLHENRPERKGRTGADRRESKRKIRSFKESGVDLRENRRALAGEKLGKPGNRAGTGGGWLDTPYYDKDYRGSQPCYNVTKEKRPSARKEKFVQLTVSLANDLDKHKVWCPADEMYITGVPYDNEQITEEPTEVFTVVMHFKINILACSHPDYDWISGIEVELHKKQPEVKVVRRGLLRKCKAAPDRASELCSQDKCRGRCLWRA
ncbi:hypothetical protein G5714_022268 [Onychostoma macrolepis]|uniref:Uncharacterized protein n=1 Tax=Onychostoma macrolepis TaxID=369639 RepID=A0A7J6BMN6_9TELE|nr:hypothetical protein G5714_022268 [Onychostoma macrolepis]